MKEVELHIQIAREGSGYSLSKEHDTRTAFIRDDSFDNTNLIVPLTEQEEEQLQKNIVEENDVRGLLVTNVHNDYFEI
jgi:hypothetical protein